MPDPPQGEGKVSGWITAAKGLTVSNVLVLALLAVVAVPVYVIYKALSDEMLLDRLMSTYEEISQPSGCTLRHVQERGGPELYSVSSGFAFQGADRWFVSVVVQREPSQDEIDTYCASLKLIADAMLARGNGGSEIHPGSMPGAQTNGSGHDGAVPADPAPAEEEAEE